MTDGDKIALHNLLIVQSAAVDTYQMIPLRGLYLILTNLQGGDTPFTDNLDTTTTIYTKRLTATVVYHF